MANWMKGMLVVGTDTGVGKTYVTCQLLRGLRQHGVDAVGMKPVASGMVEKAGVWVNEDVEAIAQACDYRLDQKIINPYCYRPFIAPHLAAREVGEEIDLGRIEACYRQLGQQAELVVVEGAGGLMTPLTASETFIDLARRLSIPVLLVTAIRLGCINHSLLTAEALVANQLSLMGWIANYPDSGVPRNIGVEGAIEDRLQAPLLGIFPHLGGVEAAGIDLDQVFDQHLC